MEDELAIKKKRQQEKPKTPRAVELAFEETKARQPKMKLPSANEILKSTAQPKKKQQQMGYTPSQVRQISTAPGDFETVEKKTKKRRHDDDSSSEDDY